MSDVATDGFDPNLYPVLASLEEGSFWFRSRNELIAWAIGQYGPPGWARFLEVGCGTGFVLRMIRSAFPHAALTGTELFVEGLAYASERVPDADLRQLDARAMPYRMEFDVVGAFDVIEHIDADETALIGMHDALRPGGVLLLTVPQHAWLWSEQDVVADHVRRYDARSLHAKVRGAGFEIVRSTSFVSLLLPALIASRRLLHPGDSAGLRQPRVLGRALEAVMGLESRAIRAGMSFPIGGSRLVVAVAQPS